MQFIVFFILSVTISSVHVQSKSGNAQENIPANDFNSYLTHLEQQFNARMSAIEAESRDMKRKIIELSEENLKLKEAVNDDIQTIVSELKGYKMDNHLLNKLNHTDIRSRSDVKGEILMDSFVSFTVYMTDMYEVESSGDPVIFEGTVANFGGHYNTTTGIFTCPHTAYYLFMLNILASTNPTESYIIVELTIDRSRVFRVYARDFDTHGQGSNSAVILCNCGQEVSVISGGSGMKINGGNSRYSSFTGTLLRIV